MAEYTYSVHISTTIINNTVQRASKHLLYRIQTAPRQPVPTTSIGLALFLIPLMFAMHFQLSTLYPPSTIDPCMYTLCVVLYMEHNIVFIHLWNYYFSKWIGWIAILGAIDFLIFYPQTMRNRSEQNSSNFNFFRSYLNMTMNNHISAPHRTMCTVAVCCELRWEIESQLIHRNWIKLYRMLNRITSSVRICIWDIRLHQSYARFSSFFSVWIWILE